MTFAALGIGLLLGPAQAPQEWKLQVEGAERTAVVYAGAEARSKPSPVVFVFHGHGGAASNAARRFGIHRAWPEATVVYPQGLPVQSIALGRTGPGWQHAPGEAEDRDLKLYDALTERLSGEFKVDPGRVFSCGMSNGALFTLELLAARPERTAAFAAVAGAGRRFLFDAKTPRPVMLIFGKNDSLVSLGAAEATRDRLRALNRCGEEREWGEGFVAYEPKEGGARVVWNLHGGGHVWPPHATEAIVRFFKEHPLPAR